MPDESPSPDNTLYLIDGHAQIFRSYYAIRTPMSSPITGEPTGAVFAFTGMMLKLFEQFHPRYVAMAIDTPGKTFRDEMYPDYKANREAPPEDFAQQIPRIFEITKLFGVPIIGVDAAEADDVIATITRRMLDDLQHADMDIRIVSKDKDLEQLLDDRVTMFDIHTDTTLDVDHLKEQRGITPDRLSICSRSWATTSTISRGSRASGRKPPRNSSRNSARSRTCSTTSTRSRANVGKTSRKLATICRCPSSLSRSNTTWTSTSSWPMPTPAGSTRRCCAACSRSWVSTGI